MRREPNWREDLANYYVSRGMVVRQVKVNGSVMAVDLRDYGVGRPLYVDRKYEIGETTLLHSILKPGMTFVDVGANIGYFTALAAKVLGPSGKVIAFEPDPYNFSLLTRNVSQNLFSNVLLKNCALGSAAGQSELFFSDSNFGDHRLCPDGTDARQSTTIRVEPLDSALDGCGISHIDVLKMDVQGYELEVVRGAKKALGSSGNMLVLTELWPYGLERAGGSAKELFQTFMDYDFKAFALGADGIADRVEWVDLERRIPAFDKRRPDSAYLNVVFKR